MLLMMIMIIIINIPLCVVVKTLMLRMSRWSIKCLMKSQNYQTSHVASTPPTVADFGSGSSLRSSLLNYFLFFFVEVHL